MNNLFAAALPDEIKEIFTEPTFPESSRIDIIGQNGNEGLHYKPNSYAIQSEFSYGWDFVGFDDEDGLRETFKTKTEAKQELKEIIEFTQTPLEEWRIAVKNVNQVDY